MSTIPQKTKRNARHTQFRINFEDIAPHLINDATCGYSDPKENHVFDSSHRPTIAGLWREHWIATGWENNEADKLEAAVWQLFEAVEPERGSM